MGDIMMVLEIPCTGVGSMVYVLLFSVAYHDIWVHDGEMGIGRRFRILSQIQISCMNSI